MMEIVNNTEFAHYGVLGMKWGVHKINRLSRKKALQYDNKKAQKKTQIRINNLKKRIGKNNIKLYKKKSNLDHQLKKIESTSFVY